MSECPRDHRVFPGCKFEPIYDLTPPSSLPKMETTGGAAKAFIEALTAKKFRGTYCTRCGRKGEMA